MKAFEDFDSARNWLVNLRNQGSRFGVDRMRLLAEALGHPERAVPCIHVAGTNGKGSVCAMLEAMLRAGGFRTGLYTSPHLVHLGERVQVDRVPMESGALLAEVNALLPVVQRLASSDPEDMPSFFELMTAIAFRRFRDAAVDVAVVEVGLGGRLDATNVVAPELCVITSIGFDHEEYLGNTLEQIAAEKAGIIKPGVPVVLGHLPPEAEAVIRAIAAERGAPVHGACEHFGSPDRYPTPSLEGEHQRVNAATAWTAMDLLAKRFPVAAERRRAALADVKWAGRWERRTWDGRTLILDASHNAEGARTLDALLEALGRTGVRPHIISGVLGEVRAAGLLPVLARHAASLHLVRPDQPRATEPARLLEIVSPLLPPGVRARSTTLPEIFPADGHCPLGNPGDTVVVTGSIYLLGEVIALLDPRAASAAAELGLQDRLAPGCGGKG